jgi:hypothetical protein
VVALCPPCQWLVAGRWFSPVSSTNKTSTYHFIHLVFQWLVAGVFFWVLDFFSTIKTDHHDLIEIL